MLFLKRPPGSQKCFSSQIILVQNVCPPFQSGWMEVFSHERISSRRLPNGMSTLCTGTQGRRESFTECPYAWAPNHEMCVTEAFPRRFPLTKGLPHESLSSRRFPSRSFPLTKVFPTEVVLTNILTHGSLYVQGSLGPAGQIQEIVFKGSYA